ncbi:MAG: hypothetical protein EOO42_06090 [Flavobacteriales bacterium]|nr:MAG: hypothetical protein EOO42_06090 [Flavobacteriales bacterium]
MKTGKHENYYWVEITGDIKSLTNFLEDFSGFLLNLTLAIVAFDGDSFKPTTEEYSRGWIYNENEIAIFNNLNSRVLDSAIHDNSYDQWVLFERPIDNIEMEIYVTHSGFSIGKNFKDEEPMKNLSKRFWNWMEQNQPSKFLINGDNFIYGTNDFSEIEKIKSVWTN